jgi:superfamily II DNA/RNA helicase
MLDIGFAPAIEEILTTTPDTRQTALFSATMPDWIAKLEQKFLKNPVKIDAIGAQSTIEQIAYQVPHNQKIAALCTLLQAAQGESSLIFGRTKFGVEKLGKQLSKLGFTVGTLHGNKSQRAREEVLTAFRRGHVQTLLATNVAARGLDIHGIYQVINYELPESSNLFTHRIGRTGRMGRQGKAITLLVPSDMPKWRIMARSLDQVVALQRLVIDDETFGTIPTPRLEIPETRELEQKDEQQPKRDRKHVSQGEEHKVDAPPEHDRHTAPSVKRHSKESGSSRTPTRRSSRLPKGVSFPERSCSSKERHSRRGAGKHQAYAFADQGWQHSTIRRKSRTRPATRMGKPKRAASR